MQRGIQLPSSTLLHQARKKPLTYDPSRSRPPTMEITDSTAEGLPTSGSSAHLSRDSLDPWGPVIDSNAFRSTMRLFAASVTVVTVRCGEQIHGMTATAVSSVCLDPPLMLICVTKNARTHRLISESGLFAVNLLHSWQQHLADRFAGRHDISDRFSGVPFGHAVTGAPILDNSLGYWDCLVVATYDGGDHTIFLGQVQAASRADAGFPLLYYEGSYLNASVPVPPAP